MQTIKTMLLVGAFIATSVVTTAAPIMGVNDKPTIKEEITKLLRNPDISVNQNTTVMVQLLVNDQNELVILSVNTQKEPIEHFIKGRLNYHKLKNKLTKGEVYLLPVTITSQ